MGFLLGEQEGFPVQDSVNQRPDGPGALRGQSFQGEWAQLHETRARVQFQKIVEGQ
jgi:hypothetical protein